MDEAPRLCPGGLSGQAARSQIQPGGQIQPQGASSSTRKPQEDRSSPGSRRKLDPGPGTPRRPDPTPGGKTQRPRGRRRPPDTAPGTHQREDAASGCQIQPREAARKPDPEEAGAGSTRKLDPDPRGYADPMDEATSAMEPAVLS